MRHTIESLVEKARLEREIAINGFRRNPSGWAYCKRHSRIADRLVIGLYRLACESANDPGIAVVATGGYGRKELAPRSDIDITFIAPEGGENESEQIVRELFRLIFDAFSALDWPVGYSYRLMSDCPALDSKTRSGLLDARPIVGSKETFARFSEVFFESFPVADFLIEKIEERDSMRKQWHDTPRVVEFHVREGAGGLRDLQAANWMAKALGRRQFAEEPEAVERLLTIRNALHISAGRKLDVLARTRIGDVASLIREDAESVVAGLIGAGEVLDSVWKRAVERVRGSEFSVSLGVIAGGGVCKVTPKATLAEATIGVCRAIRLGLKVASAPVLSEAGDIARTVGWFTRGSRELRALDQCGLLSTLLPELEACMRLPSNDSVHRYSVGEHTLRVIESLDHSRSSGRDEGVWSEVSNPRPLILAALLHDVGKVDQSAPHSETGAGIAEEVCRRLGVSDDERSTTVWLVLHHLDLVHIARTHDLAHPSTYRKLVKDCERADRLAMLFLLTLADTESVGPGVLTPQLEASLRELYSRARELIGVEAIPDDPAVFRSEAERRLRAGVQGDIEELLRTMPTHYLLATPTELFPLHADYIKRASEGETIVQFQHDPDAKTTEVTICTRDLPAPGLLSRIFGIIYALDISVHAARAASTETKDSIALDTITVSFQGKPLPVGLCRVLSSELKKRLGSSQEVDEFLWSHGKDPNRLQTMLTHTYHEGRPGILEFQTPPGRGMPYRVAKMLAGLGWNVHHARMGVYADKAVARFYLELPGGRQLPAKQVEKAFGKRGR